LSVIRPGAGEVVSCGARSVAFSVHGVMKGRSYSKLLAVRSAIKVSSVGFWWRGNRGGRPSSIVGEAVGVWIQIASVTLSHLRTVWNFCMNTKQTDCPRIVTIVNC